ncbi:MAG: bifunctional (p)ppGpp synthetase/guanosine-3',5'-bis(diphosphate) 3'-pyrophosphohydrolase [Dictyoglomi bacterium]|nr:bifunctional (p)ppGpp synthetase/guanosine-3',5'-bis(diphosphate) 3'-pyrophosphohydrolase [Dictyoglomota bacterium]
MPDYEGIPSRLEVSNVDVPLVNRLPVDVVEGAVYRLYSTVLWNRLRDALSYMSRRDINEVRKAYEYMEEVHRYQRRKSGEPYIVHTVAVAIILSAFQADVSTIQAALLHDSVEDNPSVSLDDIREKFGTFVAKMVDGVTKLTASERNDQNIVASKAQVKKKAIRKLLINIAQEPRVAFLKLADRLHNMRTIIFMSEEKRKIIARETMEVYVPLAQRLGIYMIKTELEELSFKTLYPHEYEFIKKRVIDKIRGRREQIREVINNIYTHTAEAMSPHGIIPIVKYRVKSVPSIYRKMESLGKSFDEIYDLVGVRVILDWKTPRDEEVPPELCYQVLGIVHSLYTSIPDRFKDFISRPKPNGYRSLHTTIFDGAGEPLEVQIRTIDMHREAEFGVAAHWAYKEGEVSVEELKIVEAMREKLSSIFQTWGEDPLHKEIEQQLFADEIMVFTPKGQAIFLPEGATPVDFAYAIHTEVGHRCTAAKVNGKLVPLDYQLQSGDQVEIITSKTSKGPKRDWLYFVKSSRARDKIRSYFKRLRREEELKEGKQLLEKVLHRLGVDISKFKDAIDKSRKWNLQDLYIKLARLKKGIISGVKSPDRKGQSVDAMVSSSITNFVKDVLKDLGLCEFVQNKDAEIKIVDVQRKKTKTSFYLSRASCCQPLPGEEIVGWVTTGKGIVVHRRNCPVLKSFMKSAHPDRLVKVSWDELDYLKDVEGAYPTKLVLETWDRKGLLLDIAKELASLDKNISRIKTYFRKRDGMTIIELVVSLKDINDYHSVRRKLLRIRGVEKVKRGKMRR